jgi:hypothetical protein
LNNPAQTFGLLPNQPLHGTFLALDLRQAVDNLWEPYTFAIKNSPWFQQYHEMLEHYSEKYGEEYIRFKETFIQYRHKNIILYPATPDKRKLRGRTRFLGSIDELGWFDVNNEGLIKLNAEQVYVAMRNSFRTLRSAHAKVRKKGYSFLPVPMFGNISSPSSKFDKITNLTTKNKNSKTIFTRHYATWEMNPEITQDDLQDEFNQNHANAMRDYGAVPPFSSNSFISDFKHLKQCVNRENKNAGCIPISNFYINFTSPIQKSDSKKISLESGSKKWKAKIYS